MKKFYIFLFCLLALVPTMLVLTGCGAKENYTIDVVASDKRYGSVTGNGTYSDGTNITLKATTIDSNFLCWTLNNKVVSKESEYSFQVNAETKGKYVAIFDKGCDYYVLTEANIDIFDDIKASELDFTVEAGASLSSLQTLCSTHTTPPLRIQNSNFVDNFYSGYVILNNYDDQYKCQITAKTKFDEEITTYTGFIDIDLNKLSTDKTLTTSAKRIDNFGNISLTFDELTKNLIDEILK